MKKVDCIIYGALLSISGLAEANNSKYYIQLNTGYAQGLAPKVDFEKGTMKNAGVYGAEFGYKINDRLRAGFSVDYRDKFTNKYSIEETYNGREMGPSGRMYDITFNYNLASKIKVNSLAMMANIYYDIANLNRFSPYLVFGMGASINKTGYHTVTINRELASILRKGIKKNFAYKIGAGTIILLSERFEVDLRYQFSDLGKFQTSSLREDYAEESVEAYGPKSRGKLKSHEVMVGIVYKF